MRLKIKEFLCGDVKNLSADRHGYRPHFPRGVRRVLDTRLYNAIINQKPPVTGATPGVSPNRRSLSSAAGVAS